MSPHLNKYKSETILRDSEKKTVQAETMKTYDESLELDVGNKDSHWKEFQDSSEGGHERHQGTVVIVPNFDFSKIKSKFDQ